MVLGLMGRLCATEDFYFAITGQRHHVGRRRGSGPVAVSVAGLAVPTFYHRIGAVRKTLAPVLTLKSIEGIGVAIPPPYLEPRWQQLPGPLREVIAQVDSAVAHVPPFNRLGDHVLLQFVKQRGDHA